MQLFVELVETLVREHKLLYRLAEGQRGDTKSLLPKLPKELQEPMSSVEEFSELTPTEYNLLQEFVLNAGKVLTHTHLLNRVWGSEYREDTQYLHVFVRRLRAKFEPDPKTPRYIMTVPGVGYQFKDMA